MLDSTDGTICACIHQMGLLFLGRHTELRRSSPVAWRLRNRSVVETEASPDACNGTRHDDTHANNDRGLVHDRGVMYDTVYRTLEV